MNSPPHTLIYTYGAGRLGNQIIRFAHWMAWTRAHPGEVEVLNLSFWPHANFFSLWREHPGCVYPVRGGGADRLARIRAAVPAVVQRMSEERSRLVRVVQSAGRWWPSSQAIELDIVNDESVDLEDPAFLANVARRPNTVCCGWRIAAWNLVAAQQDQLREYFEPAPEFARPAARFVDALRAKHEVLVGVLIRQSDYREWDDGRFYFSTIQYAKWIREIVALYANRTVAVIVASEEWQDPVSFAGLPVHLATGNPKAGGHWFENWVELSQCDVVVSVPSTFSATAAFRGGVPLWPIVAADQVMSFDQFIPDGMVGAARHPVFSRSVK